MFRAIWTIARKDLRLWLRHPVTLLSALLVPLSYFLVVWLGAQAVGQNPVALVDLDQGPRGAQIVHALVDADVFRVSLVDPGQAQELYNQLQVAAVVTIPANLSQRLQTQMPVSIAVTVHNFNLDLANDIRRAVPFALTSYYQAMGSASPIHISIAETPLRAQDVPLFQYSVLPLILLITTTNGIIVAGMSATNEWERRTIKELLLAPHPPITIVLGKVLAGFLSTFVLASGILVLGAVLGLTRPEGWHWLSALAVLAVSSLMSAGLGMAVAAIFQRKQPVSYVSTLVAVWLFALAGGVGVVFFEPQWLQNVAMADSLLYAIHALQQAVFYHSFDNFARDIAVLSATALATLIVGALAMRRGILER